MIIAFYELHDGTLEGPESNIIFSVPYIIFAMSIGAINNYHYYYITICVRYYRKALLSFHSATFLPLSFI